MKRGKNTVYNTLSKHYTCKIPLVSQFEQQINHTMSTVYALSLSKLFLIVNGPKGNNKQKKTQHCISSSCT
jgi:hypothetical protein